MDNSDHNTKVRPDDCPGFPPGRFRHAVMLEQGPDAARAADAALRELAEGLVDVWTRRRGGGRAESWAVSVVRLAPSPSAKRQNINARSELRRLAKEYALVGVDVPREGGRDLRILTPAEHIPSAFDPVDEARVEGESGPSGIARLVDVFDDLLKPVPGKRRKLGGRGGVVATNGALAPYNALHGCWIKFLERLERDGVRPVVGPADPEQHTAVDRDTVTPRHGSTVTCHGPDRDIGAGEATETPALARAVARARLGSNAPPEAAPDTPEPVPADRDTDPERGLERLADALLESVEPHRQENRVLARVTLGLPPGRPVAPLADELADALPLGGWIVACRSVSTGAEHFHGLALADSLDSVRALFEAVRVREGLHERAVKVNGVNGWRSRSTGSQGALGRSLYFIGRYDLAVLEKASKRAQETPVDVRAWGTLDGTDELARFALDASPSTPASRLCACGCEQVVPPGRRKYLDERHAARDRQRRRRARLRAEPVTVAGYTSRGVTTGEPVTVPDVYPPTVTTEPDPPTDVTVAGHTSQTVTPEPREDCDDGDLALTRAVVRALHRNTSLDLDGLRGEVQEADLRPRPGELSMLLGELVEDGFLAREGRSYALC